MNAPQDGLAGTELVEGTADYFSSPFAPFAGGGLTIASGPTTTRAGAMESDWLSSPFTERFTTEAEEATLIDTLMAELADEAFDEALDELVDNVAARQISAAPSWSSEAGIGGLQSNEAEEWVASLAAQADRFLERLEVEFGERPVEPLSEAEVSAAIDRASSEDVTAGATELFGGFFKKVVGAAKGIAKAGAKVLGGVLKFGSLFGVARKLVPWLLKLVLNKAINRLPRHLQGPATQLAGRLAKEAETSDGEEIAATFDRRFAEAIAAPSDTALELLLVEAEDETTHDMAEPLAVLDDARSRLARQLAEASPGQAPVAELEQFVPAVMAVLPLIRTGISVFGRDRVRNLVASGLAKVIQGHVGKAAARALAPRITDIGFRLLSLESESPETLGAEALVSALEDTIREVAALPDESLAEPLRLQAEVEQAFAEAAVRQLPRDLLRPDVVPDETVGEGGVWIQMPRRARPCYRYRRYSKVYRVPITRPQARAIVLADAETLEERLLDAGVTGWPVQSEVHLYEALPGTHVGHLAAFETDEQEGEVGLSTDEFEELTPETAALLVGEPGLGRRATRTSAGRRLQPGQRLFRVVVPGTRVRRRKPRLIVRFDISGAKPVLKVHLRLGERQAHAVAERVARKANAQIVGMIRGLLGPSARKHLASRLDHHARRRLGAPLPSGQSSKLAAHLAETMVTTLAKQLPSSATALSAAARDPAPGLTLTFEYSFADKAAIGAGTPDGPTMSIRAGRRRD